MKWYIAVIFAVVSMVAGFFIHPVISPCDSSETSGPITYTKGPNIPDTVIVERYIYEKVPVYITRWKEKTVEKFIDKIIIDTIYVEKKIPIFRSIDYFNKPYYNSMIVAWAKAPVDSFYNKVTINYDKYYNDIYANKVQKDLRSEKFKSTVWGFTAGIAATALTLLIIN